MTQRHLIFLLRILLVLALCAAASCAHAELQFCVSTSAALNDALQAAKDQEQAASIRIVQGTYANVSLNGNSGYDRYFDRIALYGGFGPGCASRTLDPHNTVLNLATAYGVQSELYFEDGLTDDVVVEGVTVRGGRSDNDFELFVVDASGHGLFLRDNIFEHPASVVCLSCSSMVAVLQNNQIAGLTSLQQTSGCALSVSSMGDVTDDGMDAYLINNTIAGNALQPGNVFNAGACIETRGNVGLFNNIFYNNAGVDLHNTDQGPSNDRPWLLVDNIIGTSANLPGLDASSTGTSSANPQFVNPAGDFHLQHTSPAINSGEPNPTFGLAAVDLDGQARVVGTRPDRGAYESNVDDAPGLAIAVTNAADSGAGTLRQAIINANAAGGTHIISFNLPGACPQTITLSTPLDVLTSNFALLGYTQPGSAANTAQRGDDATRCVILDGHLISSASSYGLRANGGAGSFLRLDGLAFEGFKQAAVQLLSGKSHAITGNQFGGSVGSVALAANAIDILLVGTSSDSTIGGASPAQRNVISGATIEGIGIQHSNLANSTGNTIIGNLIGTTPDGNGAAPNTVGVFVQTQGNFIASNTISGNLLYGVQLDGANASGNVVVGNLVGIKGGVYVNLPGFDPSLPNAAGVVAGNGTANNIASANTIAHNGGDGVTLNSGAGLGNRLVSNRIYANGQIGIDLVGTSGSDDDADPNATNLPNRGLNVPVIAALGGARSGQFGAHLASTPGNYTVQFFWNAGCPANASPQGQSVIGSLPLTINGAPGTQAQGDAGGALVSTVGLLGGGITATATDAQGNTSGFSACVPYGNDVIFADGFE